MWRNDDTLCEKATPFLHRRGQGFFGLRAEMPLLRITADQDFQFKVRQAVKERCVPGLCAAFHGRDVGAFVIIARKAKPHRDNRDPFGVVKCLWRDV